MIDLLHRTLDEPHQRSDVTGPPKAMPDIERLGGPPWPPRAKLVTAVLGVLAFAGAFGTIIQLVQDDGSSTADQAVIADLTEQRDDALAANDALTADMNAMIADVDRLTVDVELLQADNTRLGTELETALADGTATASDLAAATALVADLNGQVIDLQTANDTLTATNAELQSTADTLRTERDALAAMFPMSVDTSLVGVDVTGTYSTHWLPVYNFGLADVVLPNVRQVVISRTPEQWLQVGIPGVVTTDLARSDGALFTIVDTTTLVPAVGGVARTARMAITIYAGETVTAQNGTTTVTDLGMTIAISTPAVGGAPAGVALYGAELTPLG